jgi:hypothetical protein
MKIKSIVLGALAVVSFGIGMHSSASTTAFDKYECCEQKRQECLLYRPASECDRVWEECITGGRCVLD